MSEQRLTGEKFKEMLDRHPEFKLCTGVTKLSPCGGCAMALAYYDRYGSLEPMTGFKIIRWAEKEFGYKFLADFMAGFDGDVPLHSENDGDIGDGIECRRVAIEAGRL